MATKTTPWDPADHLRSDEAIAEYITAALEDGDPKFIAACLGDVARARGMAMVAKEAGLSRESLYRSLSAEGNPSLGTIVRVAKALGIKLVAKTDEAA
jgi:probable addiction module antidote protein